MHRGRIIVLPSTESLLHGEMDKEAIRSLDRLLKCIDYYIVSKYSKISQPLPFWIDSIMIRNEEDIRSKYHSLEKELNQIREEKAILSGSGHSLTRKVAHHLEWLGFNTEEKESGGVQDIEITDGDFRGIVECAGSKGYFKIEKVRQLIEYVAVEGVKGIFIGNPWKDIHPKERNLSKAFTDQVIKRATALNIGLITVPHLYRVCLDIKKEDEKDAVRDTIENCIGIWEYPSSLW